MKEIHIVFQVLNFLHGDHPVAQDLYDIERLVLINLASHKGKKGICPSIPRIVTELKSSRTSIIRTIKYLVSKNLLKVVKNAGKRNTYTLNIPRSTSAELGTSTEYDTGTTLGTTPVPSVVQTSTERGTLYNKEVTKTNREGLLPVDNFQEQKPVDQYFTKQSYRFNMAEREEAIRRDIDIQVCFNKFCDGEVNKRLRKDGRFKQVEWDNWFKGEREGKNAKKESRPVQVNEHLIEEMRQHNRRKQEEVSEFNKKRWHELMAETKAKLQGKVAIN